MDYLKELNELGLGSRLKRLSEYIMKETQLIYDHYQIDFDPYLFPVFKYITKFQLVTTSDIADALVVSQPAITQAVNKLTNKGYIINSKDKTDKRKKNIALSSKGMIINSSLKPLWKSIDSCVIQLTNNSNANIITHLNELESKFKKQSFSDQVIEYHDSAKLDNILIESFRPEWSDVFRDLNVEWLEKYFVVEPYDLEVLSNAQSNIIDKQGYIFFAKQGDNFAGTVALSKIDNNTYELNKMAVYPEYQGLKIGQKLMQHCIDFSRDNGWHKLILYSNKKLENAIHIYRKYGFIQVDLEKDVPYLRSNIKMELNLT